MKLFKRKSKSGTSEEEILLNDIKFQSLLSILPVEIVYQILDYLQVVDILISMQNVCKRINAIINTYPRYKVNYVTYAKIDCEFFEIDAR